MKCFTAMDETLEKTRDGGPYDICVIGGGINGCGIARDAAGRGYDVLLAEQHDLASGTSSGSTKLIHGGLRYLEFHEFRLVREALREREVLWRIAPHLIRPMRFVLPVSQRHRPAWLLRLGLFLYDNIGGRKLLPPTRTLDMGRDPAAGLLKPEFRTGFEYSDAWVDDARLVIANARDAADRGADIRTCTEVVSARRIDGLWRIGLRDRKGRLTQVHARVIVNAAGPWVDDVLTNVVGQTGSHAIRLVQGSHIVVPRISDDERAFVFQNHDGRIVFAIPFHDDFTLIGTTDRDYHGEPASVSITREEIDYLCLAAGDYFRKPVRADDIVWSYAAVRPLFDDGASKAQEATRDYVLKVDGTPGAPPLMNIFGGKITTYRRLAAAVMEEIENALGRRGPGWTDTAPLPGGDFPVDGLERLADRLMTAVPFLDPGLARRLVRAYGTKALALVSNMKSQADLGQAFGAGLYQVEVDYLVSQEWARTAEDIVWRRTKLGLYMTAAEISTLRDYLTRYMSDEPDGKIRIRRLQK